MTCSKCNQPIKRGQKFHRTVKGYHHRECPPVPASSVPVTVVPPTPVIMCDCFSINYFSDGSKRLFVKQYTEDGTVFEVAQIHLSRDMTRVLAPELLKENK